MTGDAAPASGDAAPASGDGGGSDDQQFAATAFHTGDVTQYVAAGGTGFVNTGTIGGDVTAAVAAQRDRTSLIRSVLLPNKVALPLGRVPPSFLLRSGFAVVAFRGRETELGDLLTWCLQNEDPLGMRLCVAPGGQGKTRLAQELGARLEERGWLAGRLRTRYDETALAHLLELPDDLLLVVDYAETAPSAVLHLAESLAQPTPPRARRRVLLLARSSAGWWEMLRGRLPDEIAVRAYSPPYELPPLFADVTDRAAEFQTAVQRFAHVGGYPDDDVTPPRDLADNRFGHALTLHMTALAALLDHTDTARHRTREAPAEDDPAARILDHERRYWSDTAAIADLPDVQPRTLDAVMLMASCTTADARDEAIELLAHLPVLAEEHRRVVGRYADWAHSLQFGDRWLNPLEPDLLAEYFFACALHEQPELPESLADAVSTVDQRANTLWTLARAAARYSDAASALTRLLRCGSDKLWLTGALLAAYLDRPEVLTGPVRETLKEVRDPSVLSGVARDLPGSYRVADLKVAIAAEALDRYRALPERDYAVEADLLDELAEGLYYADRFDEVELLLPQVLKLFGRLVKQEPRRHLVGLVRAQLSYGRVLLGKDDSKALDLAKQAKKLATSLPAAARAGVLAGAHDLHAQALHRLGDSANALLEARKAVEQGAVAAQSEEWSRQWQPMLLMNLANRYSNTGNDEQALDVMSDAVRRLRELERDHVDPLWPNMILALFNYAQCLWARDQVPEARLAIADAARRVRRLTPSRPNFRTNQLKIAASWSRYLSACTANDPQVRAEYEYIIDMLAQLAEAQPTAAGAHADAMLDYAKALARAGDHTAAQQWRTTAARISRAGPKRPGADTLRRARDLIRDLDIDAVTLRLPSGETILVPRPDPGELAQGEGKPPIDGPEHVDFPD